MEKLHPSASIPKMQRRVVEKNRRNHMKGLYSKLYSLLPSSSSKDVLTIPDQIDKARIYIESLQKKLEMYKEKEEKLLQGKRPYSPSSIRTENPKKSKVTNVEIHGMGPNMDVIFLSGLEEQASFYGIIGLLSEEGFKVANANFSNSGNSVLQISYEKDGKSTTARADSAAAVSKRLKELIYGYSQGEVESRLDFWDFDQFEPDLLTSDLLRQIMACDVPSSIPIPGV